MYRMPNTYFQFRQFIVHQDKCAMKVTTDACLFGAVVANEVQGKVLRYVLDIGTGTGLLSLMTAQKNNAVTDAVEIDTAAFEQAKENFSASPWSGRMTVFNDDIKIFSSGRQYDLIISNPPFYENYLRSADEQKNAAKHTGSLNFEELLTAVQNHLATEGIFAVLLPYAAIDVFISIAGNKGFHLVKKVLVRQTPKHSYFRGILFFERTFKETISEEIIIKGEGNNYTKAFVELLKDYYLNL